MLPTDAELEAELNPEQLRAVRGIHGPVLIIAGAGSGKTRVITFRIARMLSEGIHQSAILALTFTNKAAREMASRVRELMGRKLPQLTVSTFHAFGLDILRRDIQRLGYRERFSIYDEVDRRELIKETGRELGYRAENLDLFELGKLFSDIKTGRAGWDDPLAAPHERLYKEYQRSLKAYNAVDFDDLIVLPVQLLESDEELREAYRRRFRYVMVDEFQDTSREQYRLLRLVAGPNVCVVGDDDQSIYSWRGADYGNILAFERDYPDLVEIKLEQNYRSTGTILEAANGVISHNANRKEKALWSGHAEGRPIDLCVCRDEAEEAAYIADAIRRLRISESVRLEEFGVLLRTNALIRHIEEAFLADGLPYRVSGGTSFFQRKEVKDIVSYLRVVANPDDDVNFLRIVNTPRRGIGRKTVEELGALAARRGCSLYAAIAALEGDPEAGVGPRERADLSEFRNLIEYNRAEMLGRKAIAPKVRALVEHIDYWGHLLSENQKSDKAARWKFMNVESLIESIERWERDPDNLEPGLYEYLNRISLVTRDDLDDQDGEGKINLMTIHAAKGLEFEVVFIAGCEDGIIPHARSLEEGQGNLEEERRLFYVAITRAAQRRRARETVDCAPSPFLAEIPPQLIQTVQAEEPARETDVKDAFARMRARFKAPI
jgi:DNA helicase-2/ATP-dependent DNA helicase PcrA